MKKPSNKYILSCMEDKSYNVMELPCGWLIVHLRNPKPAYLLDLTSEYGMFLNIKAVLYEAELINDEGQRWAGLTPSAFCDPWVIDRLKGPENIFLSKDRHMAWDRDGRCIHWGPSPFPEIDAKYEAWLKTQMEDLQEI